MTASQLEPSAHAPCSSTMMGLGPPPPAAWAAAALAGATWLTETSSPTTHNGQDHGDQHDPNPRETNTLDKVHRGPFLLVRESSAWKERVRVCGIPSRHPGVLARAQGCTGRGRARRVLPVRGLSDRLGTSAREWGVRRLSQGVGRGSRRRRRGAGRHRAGPPAPGEPDLPVWLRTSRGRTRERSQRVTVLAASGVAGVPSGITRTPESRLGDLSQSFVSAAGQHAMELVAGANAELGEDLVQVVFDRARAYKQLGRDGGVGQAVAG